MSAANGPFVIVGGGTAAGTLAQFLRRGGWQGQIAIVSDENAPPYHRPPLSKSYLTEQLPDGQLQMKPRQEYRDADIDLHLETRVLAIDRKKRILKLEKGEMPYEKLALCTGARPRQLQLPGTDLDGLFYLRDLTDGAAIRKAAQKARNAVIVGGGYIGLEIAASLRKLGLQVQVLEVMDRLLQRVTAEQMSQFFARLHTEEGVKIRTGAKVKGFAGKDRIEAVQCGTEELEADMAIVGIGVVPNVELAKDAGLIVDDGIFVDDDCRTQDGDIFALGDCCTFISSHYQRPMRLESIPNATSQAKRVAAIACDQPKPEQELPWFWSDQYNVKLQIAGISDRYERVVVRGDDTGRSFSLWYLAGERLLAAECVNQPKEFIAARQLIAEGQTLSDETLADPNSDLSKAFGSG